MGRLTLNPLHHFDPIGALCMLFFHFGWARPVPIDTRYFKKPKRDMVLVALAGPVSNLLLAFFALLISRIFFAVLDSSTPGLSASQFSMTFSGVIILFLTIFISMNVSFGVFNLLPIPPLDGSRLLMTLLPPRPYLWMREHERYFSFALVLLLVFGLLDIPLSFLVNLILSGMNGLINLIPFL